MHFTQLVVLIDFAPGQHHVRNPWRSSSSEIRHTDAGRRTRKHTRRFATEVGAIVDARNLKAFAAREGYRFDAMILRGYEYVELKL